MPKIRRIGHSVGVSINPSILAKAGLAEGEAVDISAGPGELRIQRAGATLALHLTAVELDALVNVATSSRAWASLMRKARKLLKEAG